MDSSIIQLLKTENGLKLFREIANRCVDQTDDCVEPQSKRIKYSQPNENESEIIDLNNQENHDDNLSNENGNSSSSAENVTPVSLLPVSINERVKDKLGTLLKDLNNLPNVLSEVNTEIDMICTTLPVVSAKNKSDLWTFEMPIEWEGQRFYLPIKDTAKIKTLDNALGDEKIFGDVVNIGRLRIFLEVICDIIT